MKILSLTESFITLICEKKKLIETRSWKTNYKGELYIHESMTKLFKNDLVYKELMSLVDNKNMNFGNIICKCNLVDCIYMTKEFVKNIKNNNHQEYICGEYSIDRYDWILENIKHIKSVKTKSQLNIWDYYNEFDVMNLMENIEYGWGEKDNKYYWFEYSWESFKGIHEYNSLKDLIIDVRDYELNNNYNKNNLCIYDYKKPKFHLNVMEFYKHYELGVNILLEDM